MLQQQKTTTKTTNKPQSNAVDRYVLPSYDLFLSFSVSLHLFFYLAWWYALSSFAYSWIAYSFEMLRV